jgi:hypothetical protein
VRRGVISIALSLAACTPFGGEEVVDAGSSSGSSGTSSGSSGSPDATPDGPTGPCPAERCSSCAGGVCRIDCPGPLCGDTVTCPPKVPCRVVCTGAKSCEPKTIECADAASCTLDCNGGQDACEKTVINAGTNPICLSCSSGPRACDNVKCNSGQPCSRACFGGGCTDNASCPNCGSVASCP